MIDGFNHPLTGRQMAKLTTRQLIEYAINELGIDLPPGIFDLRKPLLIRRQLAMKLINSKSLFTVKIGEAIAGFRTATAVYCHLSKTIKDGDKCPHASITIRHAGCVIGWNVLKSMVRSEGKIKV